MDCVETNNRCLRPSFWPPQNMISFKPLTPPQVFPEDVWCGSGYKNDDSFVQGLLDFSNEEEEDDGDGEDKSFPLQQLDNQSSCLVKDQEFESVPGSELSVPAEPDELANLEWLSHFVDESFSSEYSLQHHGVVCKPEEEEEEKQHQLKLQTQTGGFEFEAVPPILKPVCKARRSKRSRAGGRAWSLGSLSQLTESSSSSSSSSSFSSSSSSSCCLINNNWCLGMGIDNNKLEWFNYVVGAKKKKKLVMTTEQRRCCSHCGVQKTPQWRTGPLGAKTLCNACGVRYKSGRLLPEYRPACSPTFSAKVHSNNHRKVLEMRRNKQAAGFWPEYH